MESYGSDTYTLNRLEELVKELEDALKDIRHQDGHKVHSAFSPPWSSEQHRASDSCPRVSCVDYSRIRRYENHVEEHGCMPIHCPEAERLFQAQPSPFNIHVAYS